MSYAIETLLPFLNYIRSSEYMGVDNLLDRIKSRDLSVSFAQNFEDVYLRRFFGHLKSGFYVDVGASHPFVASVTANLYYTSGFSGINIDPDPRSITLLEKYRPRDINVNALCACSPVDYQLFLHPRQSRSTAKESFLDYENYDLEKLEVITLTGQSLSSIFLEHNCPQSFAFLKIDVEGMEVEVVRSMDWERYSPSIVIIETAKPYDMNNKSKELINDSTPELLHLMSEAGYTAIFNDTLNSWYAPHSLSDQFHQIISTPLSINDKFIPAYLLEALLDNSWTDLQDMLR